MSVESRNVGRCDVLLHRGSDERVGVLWREDDGEHLTEKDLSRWTATYQMSLLNGNVVYSASCVCTSDGYAVASIPYKAFTDSTWDTRRTGEWRIDGAGPNGERLLLAWGYWTLC